MQSSANIITEVMDCDPGAIPPEVFQSTKPLLLKGLVLNWPLTQAGINSSSQAANYLKEFDRDIPLTVYQAEPEQMGRIFYNDDYSGFNFERTRDSLSNVLDKLFGVSQLEQAPTYYVGSTMVDHWLPGFRDNNDIDLDGRDHLMSLWLGNRSRIAAHYDFPNNIACSLVGRRRVTLFPPEQGENLYVGPLDFTPSGQPISLVDSTAPDFEKFPKYADAQAASFVIELEPGDALMIPSMWWHHIEALESFNVLVNYWWRDTPAYLGAPLNALNHAIMSLRDLPAEQRRVWKAMFDHYVFDASDDMFDHIPANALGMLGDIDQDSAKRLRTQLAKFLKV